MEDILPRPSSILSALPPPLLPPGSFLPPEKWQKINRRWDKECDLAGDGVGGRAPFAPLPIFSRYSSSRRRISRSREKSFYILSGIDLASQPLFAPRADCLFSFLSVFFCFVRVGYWWKLRNTTPLAVISMLANEGDEWAEWLWEFSWNGENARRHRYFN